MKIFKNYIQFINENKISNIDTLVSKNDKPLMMYHGGSYTNGIFKGNGWSTTSKAVIFDNKQIILI